MTCSIDGCEKSVKCRGYCPAHYNRWRRYGDPGPAGVRTKRPRRGVPEACEIEGCNDIGTRRGWCAMHYRRWLEHGDPLWEPPTTAARFWGKVTKTATCWLWTAATDPQGYGRFRDGESERTVFTKTHCIRGHEFDEENTKRHPMTGWRQCRTCNRLRQAGLDR